MVELSTHAQKTGSSNFRAEPTMERIKWTWGYVLHNSMTTMLVANSTTNSASKTNSEQFIKNLLNKQNINIQKSHFFERTPCSQLPVPFSTTVCSHIEFLILTAK